ncbi:hypothetical protein Pst134EB_002133 [Puccinia striiformis f. sp. tritici]|nr:hypothetical protein Pst134EB_002133 [Puccinia striiformis f. sp. tritici]
MNHIKPAFLLCVFCASTFVMSNCTQHQPIRGCSNGPLDERNFFIPLATHNCGSYLRWCCPAGKLQVETSYKVAQAKAVGCTQEK